MVLEKGNGSLTFNQGISYRTGKLGQGIYIDRKSASICDLLQFSSGSLISGNNYTNINADQGTISFWVKTSWDWNDGLLHYFFCSGGGDRFEFAKMTTSQLQVVLPGGIDLRPTVSTKVKNTWYHILVRWNKTTPFSGKYVEVFLDGISIENYTSTFSPTFGGGSLNLGSYGNMLDGVGGSIDDFAIWGVDLSDANIATLYNSGSGTAAAGVDAGNLKMNYTFNGSGLVDGPSLTPALTITPISQANCFEEDGIRLFSNYLSITPPTGLSTTQGAVLIILTPLMEYGYSSNDVDVFFNLFTSFYLSYHDSTGAIRLDTSIRTISAKTFSSSSELQTEICLIVSWNTIANIFEVFVNGALGVGSYVTNGTLTNLSTIKIGNHNNETAPAKSRIKKFALFGKSLSHQEVINLDNAYRQIY